MKMNKKPGKAKIVLFGGFLNAGKSTLIAEVSKRLISSGKKVAVITNNQGIYLITKESAKSEGVGSTSILDGCFCSWFLDLMKAIRIAIDECDPDYILVEPVVSCTDLLATAVIPLMTYYKGALSIAPLFIVIDGARLVGDFAKMNLENPKEPKEILVSNQIREAHYLLISKCDTVKDADTLERAISRIKTVNPNAGIIRYSLTGKITGVNDIIPTLEGYNSARGGPTSWDWKVHLGPNPDYGRFIDAWRISSKDGLDTLDFSKKLISGFSSSGMEIARADVYVISEVCSIKLSLVGGVIKSDGVCNRGARPKKAVLTLDIRAKMGNGNIESVIQKILYDACLTDNIETENYRT